MLDVLDDWNWAQVFADESSGNVTKEITAYGCSDEEFTREDVVQVLHMYDDSDAQDEPNFIGLFLLRDGRFLAATGWHDNTGWD